MVDEVPSSPLKILSVSSRASSGRREDCLGESSQSAAGLNNETSLPISCYVCQRLSCALLMRVRKREGGHPFD